MTKFHSDSAEKTIEIGKTVGSMLSYGDILLLTGQMGAGKTCIAKGVAQALGVAEQVLSPTFCLHQMLEGNSILFHHFDFYRLTDSQQVALSGLDEYFFDKGGVCLIEWWQNADELIPKKNCKVLTIEKIGENSRQITIESFAEYCANQVKAER